MKNTLLVMLLTSLISLTSYAQDYKDSDYYYYDEIENRQDMSITSEQRRLIIETKKTVGRRHAEIGKNNSLEGAEKGQAHRNLNAEIRKEIYSILDDTQRSEWDKSHKEKVISKLLNFDELALQPVVQLDALENKIDVLEDKIDDIEDFYEARIDAIENDTSLSKSEMKAKKNALKAEMKAKKKEMKKEKQALKEARL